MHDWAEFRHFRYLLAILEEQGFRAAADVLHTAQPNLSIQARQFQENAAVRLFRKMPNGRIRPTEAGIAFTALARFLLETRDEVIDALIAIERGSVGPARFGCTPFVDPRLFRTFCNLHKTLLPSSTVRPTHGDTAQLADEVAHGAVDAALVTLPLKHPELNIEEVSQDRRSACRSAQRIWLGVRWDRW
jgi:DNA-binding transcriptional LysR family regulator